MCYSKRSLPLHLNSEKTKTSCVTTYLVTLNQKMAQFNLELCFLVAVLAVFLSLASGEHHIISNLLEWFIFIWIFSFESWSLRLPRTITTLIWPASISKRLEYCLLILRWMLSSLSKACLGMWPNNWINLGWLASFTKS